ncbi:hypothetical protein RF11_08945 [Thelohanellus kitauei]|uniref:Uncharacterized protein n=1 Tax=Thelohanellus kitauei TaxID=669202 RepID=A0A0C2MED9_THEKT|nr:hypothetical protein RF11_08945 [Thelohanellus kitauei]
MQGVREVTIEIPNNVVVTHEYNKSQPLDGFLSSVFLKLGEFNFEDYSLMYIVRGSQEDVSKYLIEEDRNDFESDKLYLVESPKRMCYMLKEKIEANRSDLRSLNKLENLMRV